MAKRKVIIDLVRKKIKQTTKRGLFWSESKVIPLLHAERAEKKFITSPMGKPMSKVSLILYSGEEFDVTMFYDTMNSSFKDIIVEKVNHYLHIAQKTMRDYDVGSSSDGSEPGIAEDDTGSFCGQDDEGQERGGERQEEPPPEEQEGEEDTLVTLV